MDRQQRHTNEIAKITGEVVGRMINQRHQSIQDERQYHLDMKERDPDYVPPEPRRRGRGCLIGGMAVVLGLGAGAGLVAWRGIDASQDLVNGLLHPAGEEQRTDALVSVVNETLDVKIDCKQASSWYIKNRGQEDITWFNRSVGQKSADMETKGLTVTCFNDEKAFQPRVNSSNNTLHVSLPPIVSIVQIDPADKKIHNGASLTERIFNMPFNLGDIDYNELNQTTEISVFHHAHNLSCQPAVEQKAINAANAQLIEKTKEKYNKDGKNWDVVVDQSVLPHQVLINRGGKVEYQELNKFNEDMERRIRDSGRTITFDENALTCNSEQRADNGATPTPMG